MTDTVIVPREWLKRLDYFLQMTGVPSTHRERKTVRSMLAAAPKAEPVSDPYKSVRDLIYQAIGGIERAPSDVVTDTIWVEGTDPLSVVDALMLAAERLENIEAPKGEQEPVGQIVNASSVTPINRNEVQWSDGRMPKVGTKLYTHPAPASDELLEALVEARK